MFEQITQLKLKILPNIAINKILKVQQTISSELRESECKKILMASP